MAYMAEQDLNIFVQGKKTFWQQLHNQNIFLTGGTGFFGIWIIELFLLANKSFELNANLYVLSRNPERFFNLHPRFKNEKSLHVVIGDIKTFETPANVNFGYVIHGATEVHQPDLQKQISSIEDSLVGSKRILDLCENQNVKNLLYISSGAVYGKAPAGEKFDEKYRGTPDIASRGFAYAEAKRISEWLCLNATGKTSVSLARCFAFAGPYLDLNSAFAVTHFIKNILDRKPIVIEGDGKAVRSYMYAADLAFWLWTLLLAGQNKQIYNVGSDQEITILELAQKLTEISGADLKVEVKNQHAVKGVDDRYVPNVNKAKSDLHLDLHFNLDETLTKTFKYFKETYERR